MALGPDNTTWLLRPAASWVAVRAGTPTSADRDPDTSTTEDVDLLHG